MNTFVLNSILSNLINYTLQLKCGSVNLLMCSGLGNFFLIAEKVEVKVQRLKVHYWLFFIVGTKIAPSNHSSV